MGRFRETGAENDTETSVDISPLIDCVFILLIFFIVTTTFVEESGIQVDTPQAAPKNPTDENQSLVLVLTENGQVLHKGSDIGVSGVRPLVQETLRRSDVPVIIQSARDSSFGRLVRLIDEARLAGADKVSVSPRRGAG